MTKVAGYNKIFYHFTVHNRTKVRLLFSFYCNLNKLKNINCKRGGTMLGYLDQVITNWGEYPLRLIIAVLCGFVIGYERKNRNKEAGIRTHVIVSVASCLMMMVSKYGFADLEAARFDGSRIASQIVSGIGFLGAGMIFVHKNSIKGLTTAAGIWATSGIGMAIGSGMYFVGIITTVLVVFLQIFLHIEFKALKHGTTSEYIIHVNNVPNSVDIVKELIAHTKLNCDLVSVSKKDDGVRITVEITYSDNDALYEFIKNALDVPEIREVYAD
mgnify:CR=1 FL=1